MQVILITNKDNKPVLMDGDYKNIGEFKDAIKAKYNAAVVHLFSANRFGRKMHEDFYEFTKTPGVFRLPQMYRAEII